MIELKIYLCHRLQMVVVAQLVRALDCGSRGRRFEPGLPPRNTTLSEMTGFFCESMFRFGGNFQNITDLLYLLLQIETSNP